MRTLPWLLKRASELEQDDYTRMLKLVCFHDVNDRLYDVEEPFSSDRAPTALEVMIPQNSRLSS